VRWDTLGYVVRVTTTRPRVQIAIRLDADLLDRIDNLANMEERLRSDVIRRCLEAGVAHEEAREGK
jgi:predicted transcriptional regulator